jgi:hypothetical protein
MKLLASLFLVASLAGCAYAEHQQAVRHVHSYVADKRPMAERGDIKWSDYYKGLYNFLSAANAPGATLGQANEMIRVAGNYEAGRISKEDFEYARRDADAKSRTAAQALAQEQAQLGAAQMVAGAQLMQASGPRVLAPQVVAPAPSNAGIVGFLQSQSTNGNLRYCRYNNGVVNTINIVDLCPLNTQ